MANRTRKPQTGGAMWTGRVAGTTTSSYSNQTVYRIPTGKHWECETLAYEVLGTAPIVVRIEDSNIYRVSLDTEVLQSMIEWRDSLDLSNVELTLWTVDGDVTLTGDISSTGTFTWTNVTATSLTSSGATITDLQSQQISSATITATATTTDTLTVNSTSTFTWKATFDDMEATGTATLNEASIATASVSGALDVDGWATVDGWLTVNSWDTEVQNLKVNWTSDLVGDVTAKTVNVETALDVDWATTVENISVNGNQIVTWTSTLNWNTTVNNTLAVTGWTTLQDLTVGGNEIVSGNVTVAWNETVTGTSTLNWATTVNNKLTVSDDIIANDDLTVSWSTSLNTLETSSSASVGWQLVVWWAATIQDALTVEWQTNTETLRSDEIVTDELRVNTSLDLGPNGIAPDFVLQSEKNQPNGVAWLDENWLINASNMPDPNISFHYETSTQGSTIYTLQHAPLSDSSIMVFTDSGTALFPTIDYTCVNGVITFTQMWATESAIIWVVSKWPESNPSQNPDRSFSITKTANGFTLTWNYPNTTTTSLIVAAQSDAHLFPSSTEPTCSRVFDLTTLSSAQMDGIEETLQAILPELDEWESTNWRWTEDAYAALVYAYNNATNQCGGSMM